MARYAIGQAIAALTEKRNALRAKAKEYQNRRDRGGEICVRTHNLLLNCAQLTVAILALRHMIGGCAV